VLGATESSYDKGETIPSAQQWALADFVIVL
jgi:hypothetical protein